VQRKFRKQTTLRSKSSTLKGVLYTPIQKKQFHKRITLRRLKIPLQIIVARKVRTIALEQSAKKAVMRHVINAVYGMGTLKTPLQSIRSKEGPHYRLGAKCNKAVKDKQQSTYSQV
jgi:predicted DNA-binding antitoxin AbrB/MazE fold protein